MLEKRELAVQEQAMEVFNHLAASYNIVTISRIRGILSEELLTQAVDAIQSRHPLLNSRIVAKSNSFWFETGADKIPLSVVKKQRTEEWEELVNEELNKKINSNKNLLRVRLLRIEEEENICYLITTIHHAIADACSCIQLHSEILTNCQKITEGKAETNIIHLPQLPSIHKLLPNSLQGFTGEIRNILYLLWLQLRLFFYQPIHLGFEKSVPIESRSSGMVHRKIDSELTTTLVNLCRQQKTTVHAALGAAMLFAIARKTNIYKIKKTCLSFLSYVNLRPRLQPQISNENLGILASRILSFHHLNKYSNFWNLAREIKQKLEKGLAKGDDFTQLLASKTITLSFVKNPYQYDASASLSNIGRVNIPHQYGQFELEEISFVASQGALAWVFCAAVSTFRGKMLLNFSFSLPSISKERVNYLADDVISIIYDVCNQK